MRLLFPVSLFACCFPWRYPAKLRKVAAYQSRQMGALISLLHVIPLGGTITLLVLYWTHYWIGRVPGILTALQFVAKSHEILLQASLGDTLVYFIRTQALDGYIPFGVLSGASHASQLSYLWSLDFVSALGSTNFNICRRITFGLSVSTLLFMITTVGPSAAVLMIPRPNMAHINATTLRYLNTSEASLYPAYVDFSSRIS